MPDYLTIKTGSTHLFRWQASAPLADTPTLTVSIAGNAVAGLDPLAVVAGPGTVADGGLSADRRVLTLDGAVSGDTTRAAGPGWGEAYLITPSGGCFPVRVSEVLSSTSIRLADPLPRNVDPDSGSLQWATYWVSLGAAVTGSARRDITWSVSWEPLGAGSADGEAVDDGSSGRIVVADRPFSTGLSDAILRSHYPDLGSTTPGRDNGRAEVIEAASEELLLHLLPHLRPRSLWPEDVSGSAFRPCHAALAAARVVERQEPERAETLRARAMKLLDLALRATWADLDADGVVDAGEEGAGSRAPISLQATRLSTLFPSTVTRPSAPGWYRGRPH